MRKHILLMGVLLLVGLSSYGQFTLSGEYRLKPQYRDGYRELKALDDVGYGLVIQRVRLNTAYEKKNIGFYISVEDTRVWGETAPNVKSPGLGVYEAYMYYNFADAFGLKLGRQAIKYEDGRYVETSNWGDVGVAYDAVSLSYKSKDGNTSANLAGSISNTNARSNFLTSYPLDNYKYLLMGYVSQRFLDKLIRISFLTVNDFNQKENTPSTIYGRSTLGGYVFINENKPLSLTLNAYGQLGHLKTGQKTSTYLFCVKADYKPLMDLNLSLAVDMISGNNYGKSDLGTERAFNKLYGSTHGFLGYMDYFTVNGSKGITQGAGLLQPYVRGRYTFLKKHNVDLACRYFQLGNPFIYVNEGETKMLEKVKPYLGTEIDFLYGYQILKDFKVELGYSVMFGGGALEKLSNIPVGQSKYSQFIYMLIAYRPMIYTTNKEVKTE